MRVIFWGLVVVAVAYGAYSGMIAVWSWMTIHSAVDEVISREDAGALPAQEIRSRIMQAADEAGIPLHEQNVVVTREAAGLRVEVAWSVPVIVLRGEPVLALPLSVTRATSR
jgi:hypothetical protein